MSDNGETYPCTVPGCANMITFTKKDEEFYISKGFVNEQGQITKPRKCKMHREEAKKQRAENDRRGGY